MTTSYNLAARIGWIEGNLSPERDFEAAVSFQEKRRELPGSAP